MVRKSAVKQVIFDIWQDHLEWLPKEIQSAVHEKLGGKRSKNNTYPGLRTVQQYVAEFKANLGQLVDEDKPWSIAASVKYGLSPGASKDLFDIWRFSLAMDRPISIRQAKWIVYIRTLFYQDISTGNTYSDKVNRNLELISHSWLYSILERASRIMGEKYFDTNNLDARFMPNWEHATALKLGKVSHVNYSQEALAKLEKHGTSLTGPSRSVKSVEQAVWHSVRSAPPPHIELMAAGFDDEVLPEEDDLVAAYWLKYLSKGPLWNDLPQTPEVREELEHRRRARESGHLVLDSGGFPDDSLYSRQLAIRNKLHEWVKTDSIRRRLLHPVRTGSVIEQVRELMRMDLPDGATPPFNATLLKTVGYENTAEELELWLKLHEMELRLRHKGFDHLPADVREKFIHDEQTFDDKGALEDADIEQTAKQETKQKNLEQEFIELVAQKGGVPVGKTRKERNTFWKSIRDEWIERYPSYAKSEIWRFHPERLEDEYAMLIKKRNLNNKNSDSIKGGTK